MSSQTRGSISVIGTFNAELWNRLNFVVHHFVQALGNHELL
jgi:hypothetical protein